MILSLVVVVYVTVAIPSTLATLFLLKVPLTALKSTLIPEIDWAKSWILPEASV